MSASLENTQSVTAEPRPVDAESMQVDDMEAAQAYRTIVEQRFADFMTAVALLTPEQLKVAKRPVATKPTAVHPGSDIWGAAAQNRESFRSDFWPKSRRELSEAKRAYEAKKQLGPVMAELTSAETGIFKIDSSSGKSTLRDSANGDKGSLKHLYPGLRRSIKRTEKKYKRDQRRKEKLLHKLSPHEPSLQNIYEQTGKGNLVGLDWQEKIDDKVVARKVTRLGDEGRYTVESRSGDEAPRRYIVTEGELEKYLKSNNEHLSNFYMWPTQELSESDEDRVSKSVQEDADSPEAVDSIRKSNFVKRFRERYAVIPQVNYEETVRDDFMGFGWQEDQTSYKIARLNRDGRYVVEVTNQDGSRGLSKIVPRADLKHYLRERGTVPTPPEQDKK